MTQGQGVSLRPRDFVQGGLADNVHVRWDEVRFVQWDYNGTVNPPVLALAIAMHELTNPDSKFVQYYSAGDLKNLVPSSDGRRAVPVGSQSGINNNTNTAQVIEAIINLYPQFEDMMTDDVGQTFEGMECYMERIAQPKRTGLLNRPVVGQQPGQPQQRAGGDTVLVPKKLYKLPNGTQLEALPAGIVASGVGLKAKSAPGAPAQAQAAGAPVQPASPAASAAAPTNGGAGDATNDAVGVIGTIIAEAGGRISRKALPGKLFQKLASDPNRNAIVALAGSAAWLGSAERPWSAQGDDLAFA